jgi:ATP phosphoribosyltransferase regulatory subunit
VKKRKPEIELREREEVRAPIRLPAGVRDYLPEAASARRRVAEACLSAFERWGYARIITPLFEYADVLARGTDTPALRFVEPVSGEVVALRPDITPQIARLASSRLLEAPLPLRLCYEGSVLRLEHARGQRELIQAGVELVGAPQPQGDGEVMALAAFALAQAGVEGLTIDVGHMGFLRGALAGLPDPIKDAIARKDARQVERLVARQGVDRGRAALVTALPRLYGEPRQVLARARRLAQGSLGAALDELEGALDELAALGDARARVTVDLGEVRGFDYYTGVRFAGFAQGHGDALVVGGRYDDLCARYGRAARATGFAVDVEAVAAVLEMRAAGSAVRPTPGRGVLVAGPRPQAPRIAAALRRQGERAACQPEREPVEAALLLHAERWGFDRVLLVRPPGAWWLERDGSRRKISPAELRGLLGHG